MESDDHKLLEQAWLNLFEFTDVDKDCSITFREWVGAFENMDTNKNGGISRKEWHLHRGETYVFDAITHKKHLYIISREEWMRTFELADIDDDGSISIDEWMVAVVKRKPSTTFNLDKHHDQRVLGSIVLKQTTHGGIIDGILPEHPQRLHRGDLIISINGQSVYGFDLAQIGKVLKRVRATTTLVHFGISNENVKIPSVLAEIEKQHGPYVQVEPHWWHETKDPHSDNTNTPMKSSKRLTFAGIHDVAQGNKLSTAQLNRLSTAQLCGEHLYSEHDSGSDEEDEAEDTTK